MSFAADFRIRVAKIQKILPIASDEVTALTYGVMLGPLSRNTAADQGLAANTQKG